VRSIKTLLKIGIPTLLILVFASFFMYFSSQAASLTAVYVYMNRIQANLSTGVVYIVAVAPNSSFASGGTLKIEFPQTQDTTWCRTAGSMTVTGVSSSSADQSSGNWDIDAALPGTLAGTCSQGGASTADTITITGLTALTAGTTYGLQIAGNTGILGTNSTVGQHDLTITISQGATIDSKTFKISLVSNDSVVVSATVSESPSVNCVIGSNTVNLGTLYPGGAFAVGSHTISTTATSGYYWAAYGTGNGSTDAGLYYGGGPYLIPSSGSTTVDLNPANSEGFGIVLTQPAGGSVVPANFLAGSNGIFGSLDRQFSGARMILYKTSSAASAENSTVTYGARASTSALPGAYTETVTFICGGYY
jgi:hypothetical protein